jgi:hypothetical protein
VRLLPGQFVQFAILTFECFGVIIRIQKRREKIDMYIYDQRKPLTCKFSELQQGDLFAYEEGENLAYLMVVDDDTVAEECGKAVVLGTRECGAHLTGRIWPFNEDDEVQPLKGDLKVWAK